MPAIVISHTQVAARLLRYTEKEKLGQTEPRVLYAEGIRCRVPTATAEFEALRRLHGTQGAMRKVPDRYALPEDGEVATHLRKTRPGGKRYWTQATGDEEATHVRRVGVTDGYTRDTSAEGTTYFRKTKPGEEATHGSHGWVPQSEAVHVIVSYGLDEVNPADTGQTRSAFTFTRELIGHLYPGAQAKLIGQADAKGMVDQDGTPLTEGGKFHVHAVLNATVAEAMTLGDRTWRAGSKLSGALTNIDVIRSRADEFIDERGAEFGIVRNQVPVADQKAERRTVTDRRMAATAAVHGTELSRADRVRGAWWSAVEDDRVIDVATFKEVMGEYGVEVTEPGWRRGKPPKVAKFSYVLDGVTTRGEKLGEAYTQASTLSVLEQKVATGELPQRPRRAVSGPPRPLTPMDSAEQDEARAIVEQLARDARLDSQVRQWAQEDGVEVEDVYDELGLSMTAPDRTPVWDWVVRRQQQARAELEAEHAAWEAGRAAREQARLDEQQQVLQIGAEAATGDDVQVAEIEDEAAALRAQRLAVQRAADEAREAEERAAEQERFDRAMAEQQAKVEQAMAERESFLASLRARPAEPEPAPEPEPQGRPVKPAETYSQAAARGASLAEMRVLGQELDRWKAYVESGQQALDEAADRRAAEVVAAEQAAVDAKARAAEAAAAVAARTAEAEPVDSAAAASTPVGVAAAVPTEDDRYVSRLRLRTAKTPQGRRTLELLATFDEEQTGRLRAGLPVEEARAKDVGDGKGVGERTLREYGAGFSDELREQLELREAKKAHARRLWDAGSEGRAVKLRAEMAKGVYDDLEAGRTFPSGPVVEPDEVPERTDDGPQLS